ncbi:8234_t:CDS:2, partial [Funneliformis geosporum]
MEQAWRDERQARQQRDDEIINLRDTVCENVYEKCWWKRRYTACTQQAQNLKRYYLGFADNQVLPALYTHLPPDLRSNIKMYMAIRAGGGVNPTVDDFFQNLKKCWVERQVGVSTFTQTNI